MVSSQLSSSVTSACGFITSYQSSSSYCTIYCACTTKSSVTFLILLELGWFFDCEHLMTNWNHLPWIALCFLEISREHQPFECKELALLWWLQLGLACACLQVLWIHEIELHPKMSLVYDAKGESDWQGFLALYSYRQLFKDRSKSGRLGFLTSDYVQCWLNLLNGSHNILFLRLACR